MAIPRWGDYLELEITKISGEQVSLSQINLEAGIGLAEFMRRWMGQVNATCALQGIDGIMADDLVSEETGE